ncbi:MAG: putative bifunctional diguanylate cyclase/phosphodiesterase [Burkholderiales bacterium]
MIAYFRFEKDLCRLNKTIVTQYAVWIGAAMVHQAHYEAHNKLRSECAKTMEALKLEIAQRANIEKTVARAEIALNSISDAVIGTDMAGHVDYLNAAAENLTGWTRLEALGQPISVVVRLVTGAPSTLDLNSRDIVLPQKTYLDPNAVALLIHRDGSRIAIENSETALQDAHGEIVGSVTVLRDISAAQTTANTISHLVRHDFLTNLPNRSLLKDRISQAIVHAERHGTQLAVLFLDLDNFKRINDALGHAIGDILLQSVAQRLSACVRITDTVSRQGGDEFVILLTEENQALNSTSIAEKILFSLAVPHVIDKHILHVTASIGISTYPADAKNAETLIKHADTAMYYAKEKGLNHYQPFKKEMNMRAMERQVIESGLQRALERNELILYYQPKVNLKTGVITGAEALLRWQHPEWGMLLPNIFVPIAEKCGLINQIGRWVLREACMQTRKWEAAGLNPGSIAVNISALEFSRKDFVEEISNILQESGLAPECLQLEITESVLMRDVESSTKVLHQLKRMGVQLAVDDFGTGYSSLSYLHQFPIDILKIDQSFVQDIATDKGNGIIVSAVIAMGNSLEQLVVAEGVEQQDQLEFLQSHSCEEGQGYLFSRPLCAEQFALLLARGID